MAGVSQATVSRVLHENPNVRPATREAVLSALRESGYVPNVQARAMRTNRTGNVGVAVRNITNPFYPELIQALSAALWAAGQRMILWDSEQSEQAAIDAIRAGSIDGLVFTTATSDSVALKEGLAHRLPIVLVNRSLPDAACDQVTSDNVLGGKLVARYLLSHGHTRLAIVCGDEGISTGRERKEGFLEGLTEARVTLDPERLPHADFTHDDGYSVGLNLLTQPDRPTAVFCVNDLLAFGTLDAAMELGIKVPNDLWVVGYDDVAMSRWPALNLTTVQQPTSQMGEVAVELLLRRINDPNAVVEHRRFGGQFIVRGSTAHAPVH
jgi:LacI family transcriptional regulator